MGLICLFKGLFMDLFNNYFVKGLFKGLFKDILVRLSYSCKFVIFFFVHLIFVRLSGKTLFISSL